MKFLVVGLGSMGKRRIRCLKALGYTDIFGFDLRPDRLKEVKEQYSVETFSDFETAIAKVKPDALVISVPPHVHHIYITYAVEHNIHFFCEASVVDTGMKDAIEKLKGKKIVAVPSITIVFHPAIKAIQKIIKSGELGKVTNIIYHVGQWLPDWHTYEKVSDYYVSNPATGGAREIVPFEIGWIIKSFGLPRSVAANYRQTYNIEGAEYIDDTYNCLLDYGNFLAVMVVDVISRYATRRLTINGTRKQLWWSWDENCVKVYDPEKKEWDKRSYEVGKVQAGYNANIGENMYIEELKTFIDQIEGKGKYPNTMQEDYDLLQLLYKFEKSDTKSTFIEV